MPKSSAPSTDNDGNSLLTGALYFNSSSNQIFSWTGSAWVAIKPTSSEQTNINALSASAVVADMAILATTDVVADMNVLATNDVVADMNTLGTADVVTDMNVLATSDIVTDMNLLATSANVTAMGLLGTSANVTAMSNVSGSIANVNTTASNITDVNTFAVRYRIGSSDPSSSLDEGDLFYNTSTNAMKFYNGSAWVAIVADTDIKVSVSANDTTPNFLLSKLTAGTGISLSETNNGGNETITITNTGEDPTALAIALG